MAQTVSFLGVAASAGSTNNISFAAHNQPTGNCIVVASYIPNTSGSMSVSDTALNNYVPVFAGSGVVLSTGGIAQMWYAKNSIANSSNVVKVSYNSSNSFLDAVGWDLGGTDVASPLNAQSSAVNTSSVGSGNVSAFSTTKPNTAICVYAKAGGGFHTFSANSPFTLDGQGGQGGNTGAGSHNLVTSIQSSITPGFTWTPTTSYVMLAGAFSAFAGVPNSLMLLGVGT